VTPDQIARLLEAIEGLNRAVQDLVATSRPDLYRDFKVFLLGLVTALVAGWVSHWLSERREEGQRRLEEWERLKDWDEDGRKSDLRGTDLTPPRRWLRLRLPDSLASWLPVPRYLDLEEVNLGADKQYETGANLNRARLDLVRLGDANLEKASLRFASFEKADLEFANLRSALLLGTNLRGANLQYASLEEADLTDADLQGAHLGHANLQGADLRRANLKRADLARASLEEAYLMAVELPEANLCGANLRDAYLRGANLLNARWDGETVWPDGFTPPGEARG
jgi:uncharacterized protein YjbI with pentapeptide repeats